MTYLPFEPRRCGRRSVRPIGFPSGSIAPLDRTSSDFSLGRFFWHTPGGGLKYGAPILEVGLEEALKVVCFSEEKYHARGAVYDWHARKASTVLVPRPYSTRTQVGPNSVFDRETTHARQLSAGWHETFAQGLGDARHHFPYFGMRGEEDASNLREAFEKTNRLYETAFGERMDRTEMQSCWHDCEGRCWHACAEAGPRLN